MFFCPGGAFSRPTPTGAPSPMPARRFHPTADQRRWVTAAATAGLSQRAMALALGLDRRTLARALASELACGVTAHRLEMMAVLFDQAKCGRSRAAVEYLRHWRGTRAQI